MDHNEDIIELIKRTQQPEFKKLVEEYRKEMNYISNLWQRKNPDKQRECLKKYSLTEKGKYAISLKTYNRRVKIKSSRQDLSWEERKLIGQFYKNCPDGYEVDHIYPVSKGGKHCLSNLQYLTKEDNRRKSAKLNWN